MESKKNSDKGRKDYLDTSVVRPLLASGRQYREYLEKSVSERRYISPYICMEFRRGLLLPMCQFFFDLRNDAFPCTEDVISYWSNKVSDREVRAILRLVTEILHCGQLDLSTKEGKGLAMYAVADFIDRLETMLDAKFKDTGQNSTGCPRTTPRAIVNSETPELDLEAFCNAFENTAEAAAKCSIVDFIAANRTKMAACVKHASDLERNGMKSANEAFMTLAESLERAMKSARCSCRACAQIGDAIIALDKPTDMHLVHTDRSMTPLCGRLGIPHVPLENEAAFVKKLKSESAATP